MVPYIKKSFHLTLKLFLKVVTELMARLGILQNTRAHLLSPYFELLEVYFLTMATYILHGVTTLEESKPA